MESAVPLRRVALTAFAAAVLLLPAGCGPADEEIPLLAEVRGAPIDSPAGSAADVQDPPPPPSAAEPASVAGEPFAASPKAGGPASDPLAGDLPAATPMPPAPPDSARSADDVAAVRAEQADGDGAPLLMTFDELAVEYDADAAWIDGDGPREAFVFPEELAALEGRRISIDGFVIPTVEWGNRLSRFALSADPPGCCFGQSTALDKWIEVELKPGVPAVEYSSFGIVRVTGTLTVGEKFSDYGYVESLYQLEADEAELIW